MEEWIDELAQHVRGLTREHRQSVSLVGWSLGGIYAREVAKKLEDRARQVITIGTPFSFGQTDVVGLFRRVNGQRPSHDDPLKARLRAAPGVPTTSIFSRSDGIVPWQAFMQDGDARHTEHIAVDGSHCGLGWNPDVLAIVADRLRQPKGGWQRHARHVVNPQ